MREILRETFRDDRVGNSWVKGSAEAAARALAGTLEGQVRAANALKRGSRELEVRRIDSYGHEWAVILWEK